MKTGKKIKSVLNPDPEEKEKSGEGTEKKSLKKRFYESKMYAKHVGRFVKRKKRQAERRKERQSGGGPLFKTPEGYKRYKNRQERKKKRRKTIKNYIAGGKQRRNIRKAARSNRGDGGGFTCTGVVCDG